MLAAMRRSLYRFLCSPEFVAITIWVSLLLVGAPWAYGETAVAGLYLVCLIGGVRLLTK